MGSRTPELHGDLEAGRLRGPPRLVGGSAEGTTSVSETPESELGGSGGEDPQRTAGHTAASGQSSGQTESSPTGSQGPARSEVALTVMFSVCPSTVQVQVLQSDRDAGGLHHHC